MKQTAAAIARAAAYKAAANDPYVRIYQEAHEEAEQMYRAGVLCDSGGHTLEVEVERYKMTVWALGLYDRCQYLDWQLQQVDKAGGG